MKVYRLDNGVVTTPREVAQTVGITIKNARVRLSTYTDPASNSRRILHKEQRVTRRNCR